jgi:murein DD-endopeptidase MepM/ murein hydrolase activator NlpD
MRLPAIVSAVVVTGVLALAGPPASGDERWKFFTQDKTRYLSPWYDGAHRIMIPFGCTRAPYYPPDPRCKNDHGFHHGIDIAMKCGTPLFARERGWVANNDGLGPAYGADPILLRNYDEEWDVVIGHVRKVFVEPGDRVRKGDKIALAGDDAAPDGCHLHFERRALEGGLASAVRPRALLRLRAKK